MQTREIYGLNETVKELLFTFCFIKIFDKHKARNCGVGLWKQDRSIGLRNRSLFHGTPAVNRQVDLCVVLQDASHLGYY